MSGTRSAARRLFSIELRAGRRQCFARAVREHHVAETQARRQRLAVLAAAQDLHAVLNVLDLLGNFEGLRRHFYRRVPVGKIVQIHNGVVRAEMADVARLLRVAAPMRKATLPRRLTAFECGTFAAARTDGLAFSAFSAGLHHAGTVPAADARALGPAAA